MKAKSKITAKTSRAKTKSTSADDTEQKKALEALRESEAKFSAAFHSTPTALVITRLSDSKFELVNESFLRLLGYQLDEVVGKSPAEINLFLNPAELAQVREMLIESKMVRDLETKVRSRNGEIRHVVFSVDIIQLNQQPCSLTTMIDITERVRAEMQVIQMKRLYATLSQVNQTIVRVKDRNELYQSICDVAVKFGEFSVTWVGLLDAGSGDVRPIAANGLDVNQWPLPTVNIQTGPLSEGLIAEAFHTSRVVTSENVQTDEHLQSLHDQFHEFGFHSAAVIPFHLRGRTIGTLTLISQEEGLFKDAEEIRLLDEMGLDISFALDTLETEAERRQAEAKVERQNQRLKILREIDVAILAADSVESIVGAALSHIRELLECRRANLTLIDRATDELVIFDAKTVGETSIPTGSRLPVALFEDIIQALSQNQPILLSDLRTVVDPMPGIQRLLKDGLRSTCSLPLFAQGSLIGMFSMHSEVPGFFDEERLALGREVANQVAIALTHHHLVEGLRESEEKYHAFFENSLDAILLTSPDGSIQAANPAACKMFGRTEGEICALGRSGLVDSNDPRLATLLEERAKTGKAFGELTMLRQDGTPFPVEMSSALFQDGQGNTCTSMIIRDITERKRAEEALRKSEQTFSVIFNKAPFGAGLARISDGTYLEVNEEFERIFGFSRQEIVGKTSLELGLYPDPEVRARSMSAFKEHGFVHNLEMRVQIRTGEKHDVLVNSDLVEVGGEKYILTTANDITERKRAEEQLRYQAYLLENVNDAIVASDAGFQIKAWNLAAEEMYGWKSEEVLGRNGVEILQTKFSEADAEAMRRQIAESGYYVGEATQLRKDGTRIPVEVASIVLRDESGQITDYVSVNRDITERKRAEEELRISEERFSKAFFASPAGLTITRIADGKFIEANDAFLRMFEFSRTEVIGHTSTELNILSLEERAKLIQAQLESGGLRSAELQARAKSGRIVHILFSSKPMELGGESCHVTTMIDITERKKAEESQRESETRYRSLFNSLREAFWIGEVIFDEAGKPFDYIFVDVNPEWIRQAGLSREDIIGKRLRSIQPNVNAKTLDVFETVMRTGEPIQYENHSLDTGGWYQNYVYKLGQKNICVLSIVITERKHAEEALRDSQAQITGIVNSVMDAIISIDNSQQIVVFNPAAESMFGYSAAEAMGQPIERFLPERFRAKHAEHIRQFSQTGVTNRRMGQLGTIFGLRSNGEEFPIEASISQTQIAGLQLLTVILRDITERRVAEEKIQQQLQRLNSLRTIDTAITSSFDLQVTLEIVLQQVVEQLGVDAASILLFNSHNRTLEYTAGRGFRTTTIRQSNLLLGDGIAGQVGLERKTIYIPNLRAVGSKFIRTRLLKDENFVVYIGVPLLGKEQLTGVLEIFHRSTLNPNPDWLDFLETLAGQAAIAIDNVQLWEQVQQHTLDLEQRVAQRTAELNQANIDLEHANRTKSEFLANMSHELRTPLNSILGLSESLLEQQREPLSQRQQKYIQTMASSGQHLLDMINDILDLSKIEAGKFDYFPEAVSVEEICKSSLSFVKSQASKKSITVTYTQNESVAKIYADPRRLKQILVNLLTNAVKFTPEKGQVVLQVNADLDKDQIQFALIDTGIGIDPGHLQQLFQPFVQIDSGLNRQQEGTGLGLALVQRLTDLHGGSVEVESEVGKGSRFTVNLPWHQKIISQAEVNSSQPLSEQTVVEIAEQISENILVLLTEDNMANIMTIGDYLENHGYRIAIAHNGLEAIQLANQLDPNVILMDIQMPGMDGLDAMRLLRANPRFATTPIIALTALAMPGDRERCLEAGANEYMSKPVSLKLLNQTIQTLLATRM